MDEENDGAGSGTLSSLFFNDTFVTCLYWVSYIMSWMALPLLFKMWVWEWPPNLVGLFTFMVQVAFVGAVLYPLTAYVLGRKGRYFKPNVHLGHIICVPFAIVLGLWLEEKAFAPMVFYILASAPLFALAITMTHKCNKETL